MKKGLSLLLALVMLLSLAACGAQPKAEEEQPKTSDISITVSINTQGWGNIAFGSNAFETCIVYIVGPLVGGLLAALLYKFVLAPMHKKGAEADKAMADSNEKYLEAEDALL